MREGVSSTSSSGGEVEGKEQVVEETCRDMVEEVWGKEGLGICISKVE